MKGRRGDDEVVVSHERVELGDRLCDLGANASVGLVRPRDLGHDALGRQMLEQRTAAVEPDQMRAQASDDPRAPLGDVAPQVSP